MKGTIYVLEDDASISGLIRFSLEREQLVCRTFGSVQEFYAGLKESVPDVALLDIMLPDGNGLDVLKDVNQKHPGVCCMILSALGQEGDKVRGLNMGADDYISKPFGVMELVARVHAALRRRAGSNIIKIGRLELNNDSMTVTLDGRLLDLNKKEFELLRYCMRNADIVLPRDTLLTEIWGYVDTETRTLDNHIARLRKLGIDNFETVFGVGYRFKKS